MHQLKLLYNDLISSFYAFYQTRIVNFYLEKHDDLQPLRDKLLQNIEVFNSACLGIHLTLDKQEFDELVSTEELPTENLPEISSTIKLSNMLTQISK